MQIDNKPARELMKNHLTQERQIVTNAATLYAVGLLLLSLAAGWFNLVNQVSSLEQSLTNSQAEITANERQIQTNTDNAQEAAINLAEINTRLTSIDATLLEIKANLQ